MDYPCFRQRKEKASFKNGISLFLRFFVSFFSLHRKRDVAITGGKRYKGLRLIEGC